MKAGSAGTSGATSGVLRVLIADDQALIRGGLRIILEAQPDIHVVGEAADGASALRLCAAEHPDIVLMDVRMPGMDGLDATRRLLQPGSGEPRVALPRVVILTTFDLDEYVYRALRAGASGFLLKDASPEQVVAAVRMIGRGDTLLAPSITRRLVERFARRAIPGAVDAEAIKSLTPREEEVLRMVARGLSNAEIAEQLVVSEATVKSHVASMLGKLGLRNRVQAVVLAYESGLVEAGTA